MTFTDPAIFRYLLKDVLKHYGDNESLLLLEEADLDVPQFYFERMFKLGTTEFMANTFQDKMAYIFRHCEREVKSFASTLGVHGDLSAVKNEHFASLTKNDFRELFPVATELKKIADQYEYAIERREGMYLVVQENRTTLIEDKRLRLRDNTHDRYAKWLKKTACSRFALGVLITDLMERVTDMMILAPYMSVTEPSQSHWDVTDEWVRATRLYDLLVQLERSLLEPELKK